MIDLDSQLEQQLRACFSGARPSAGFDASVLARILKEDRRDAASLQQQERQRFATEQTKMSAARRRQQWQLALLLPVSLAGILVLFPAIQSVATFALQMLALPATERLPVGVLALGTAAMVWLLMRQPKMASLW